MKEGENKEIALAPVVVVVSPPSAKKVEGHVSAPKQSGASKESATYMSKERPV